MEIRVEHVYKAYDGRDVLKDVSMVFEDGGIYCLMGPSGLGKTTLLRIIMGLEPADRGRVLADGRPILWQPAMSAYGMGRCLRDDRQPVAAGVVFQEDRLCPWLDAVHNVAMVPMAVCDHKPLKKAGQPRGRRRGRLQAEWTKALLLDILPEESLVKPVRELSGGMCRRVAIARAVASDSQLLIMDEPFTGLDADTKQAVIGFISRERRQRLTTVVTHQEEDARALGAGIIRLAHE